MTDLLPVETVEALDDDVLVELAEVVAAPCCGRVGVGRIVVAYNGSGLPRLPLNIGHEGAPSHGQWATASP